MISGALFGGWVGMFPIPDAITQRNIALGSRKYIFLAPALGFVAMTLVVPLIRTAVLSLQTGNPRDLSFTGLDNYAEIFTDPTIINTSNWTDMFTSRLFWAGVLVLLIGVAVADPEHPIEAMRVVRSYDPCLACAVHLLSMLASRFAACPSIGWSKHSLWIHRRYIPLA